MRASIRSWLLAHQRATEESEHEESNYRTAMEANSQLVAVRYLLEHDLDLSVEEADRLATKILLLIHKAD